MRESCPDLGLGLGGWASCSLGLRHVLRPKSLLTFALRFTGFSWAGTWGDNIQVGSSCALGLWCSDTPGAQLGAQGRGCCRGRGQGPGQSVYGMAWVWFPPGSEGGVCFSLSPLEAVLLPNVGGALSGSVFRWGTVCPDTDKPVQSGCGTVEREVGLGGCWP